MNPLTKIKHLFNFKSTFTKLILSYISFSLIILFISTFTLYLGYKNEVTKQSTAVYNKVLVQANYYTQNTLDWANSFVHQLYLDSNINNLMFDTKRSSEIERIGLNKLMQVSSVVTLTQSIYVYNNNLNLFYSSNGEISSASSFYDQGIVSILREPSESFNQEFIVRKINMPNTNSPQNVITVILKGIQNTITGLPEGAILVNISSAEMENYYKDISSTNNKLFVLNSNGLTVLNSNTFGNYQDISSQNYIKRILSSKELEGNFIEKIDGTSFVVNYITSERLKLKYINITPYSSLLESMNKMLKLLVIMFIIIFIIGILFSYFFSKEIYHPIDQIIKYVSNNVSLNEPINESKNDLDYLSTAIDKILHTSLSLKNLSSDDCFFIKQKILKDLLLNSFDNKNIIEQELSDINTCLVPKNLIIFVLRIDSYKDLSDKYSQEDMSLFRYALINIATEVTSTRYNCETVVMDLNYVSVILNIKDESISQATKCIIGLIEQIQSITFSSLHFSVSSGIGPFASQLCELKDSNKKAYECTNYKIKYGPSSILFYDKIISGIQGPYKYPEKKQELLFTTINSGELDNIEVALMNIIDEILNWQYTDMVLCLIQLSLNSRKFLNSIAYESNENFLTDLDFLKDNFQRFENISEIKDWFMNMYKHSLSKISEIKNNKNNILVNKIISYIESNYGDPTLSLEVLADYVKISPNYLRTIFKEIQNQSLSHYINKFRFEKAKYFMETTEYTINDISLKVGFANTNYFYTSFKKNTGLSPSEWRRNGEHETI